MKDLESRLDDCRARDLDDVADLVLQLQARLAEAERLLGECYDMIVFDKTDSFRLLVNRLAPYAVLRSKP